MWRSQKACTLLCGLVLRAPRGTNLNRATHDIGVRRLLSSELNDLSKQKTNTAFRYATMSTSVEEKTDRFTDAETSSGSAHIDTDHLNKSLEHVNNFSKRRLNDKLPPVLMYEINCFGESSYKSIALRELLNDVNAEAAAIDEKATSWLGVEEGSHPLLYTDERSETQQLWSSVYNRGSIRSSPNTSQTDLRASGATAHPPPPTNVAPERLNRLSVATAVSSVQPTAHSNHDTGRYINDNSTATGTASPILATGALRLRDLRRLDFQFNPNEERSVLIRRHAVLFAMDPIRAVVMAHRLIIIVPRGADSLLSILDRHMQEWVSANKATETNSTSAPAPAAEVPGVSQQSVTPMDSPLDAPTHVASDGATPAFDKRATAGENATQPLLNTQDLPFEMHAFEALLTTIIALETQEFNRVNSQVQIILNYFRSGSLLPIEVQERMRNRKNDLSVMVRRIVSARHTIQDLTEDEEDLALMNLSVLHRKPSLYGYPLVPEILSKHDEMEELLESYLIDFNALESKIELTRSQIQNAEELLSLRLDTSRNELLITNTILAVLACCFGLGAYVTGIFGMNLDNTGTLQSTPHVFNTVIIASSLGMVGLFATLVSLFRRKGVFPAKIKLNGRDAEKLRRTESRSDRQ